MNKLCKILLSAGFAFGALQAQAVPTYTFTTPDFALPDFSGNGLLGSAWTQVTYPGDLPDRSISSVQAYMAGHTPDATFVSSTVDYPQGAGNTVPDESTTVAQFLGTDAATLSDPGVASTLLLTQTGSDRAGILLRLTGYYRVDVPGSVFFNIGSDDGSAIALQGTQVALNDGIHAFSTLTAPVEVAFTTPGLYALRIDWFDLEHVDAGLAFGTGSPLAVIDQSSLYLSPVQIPVPEPASAALFGLGLLSFALLKWRRRSEPDVRAFHQAR